MTGEVGNTSSSEDSRESRNDDRDILKPKSGKRWLSNRELDRLRFENPGEATVIAALDIFAGSSKDGVRRSRRRRKQVVTVNAQYMPYHDVNGSLVMQSGELVRLCDCLRITCQGCHRPCKSCESRMCGPACQKKRNYVIRCVKTQCDPPHIIQNPYLDDTNDNN